MIGAMPRYIINPLATKQLIWIPEVWQVVPGFKNSSYLHSLWLGTGWNLLDAPQRLLRALAGSLSVGDFRTAFIATAALLPSLALFLFHGVAGRMTTVNVTIDQRILGEVLSPEQAREAIEEGATLEVLDLMLLVAQEKGQLPENYVIPGFPKDSGSKQ